MRSTAAITRSRSPPEPDASSPKCWKKSTVWSRRSSRRCRGAEPSLDTRHFRIPRRDRGRRGEHEASGDSFLCLLALPAVRQLARVPLIGFVDRMRRAQVLVLLRHVGEALVIGVQHAELFLREILDVDEAIARAL